MSCECFWIVHGHVKALTEAYVRAGRPVLQPSTMQLLAAHAAAIAAGGHQGPLPLEGTPL